MPEGDTIHRTAAVLRSALAGRPVTGIDAPRLHGLLPAVGSTVELVEAHGKHLEITFDDGIVVHTHMRMTGSWHIYRHGERWRKSPRQLRFAIEVPEWLAVCFSAPVVEVYRARDRRRHPGLGSLGPDLCVAGADLVAATRRMGEVVMEGVTIAEALLDQRVASGIGNVYKSEVLWACCLDPMTPVEEVPEWLRHLLLATAAVQLRRNLDGPARVTYPDAPEGLAVYGRVGKPCFRCATPIAAQRHGEQARVTYWCPGCQLSPDLLEAVPVERASVPVR